MTLGVLLLCVIFCNVAVLILANRKGNQRERAVRSAPNVVALYRRGMIVDRRI